jgi:ABC-2 type transport system ATP-binding protein
MTQPLVAIKDLKKAYFRAKALDGISYELPKGIILGLLGPNGAGKSTLLKIIAGLVKPTSGSVYINGVVPSSKTKADIAYLPEIDHLYAWMTVKQILNFTSAFYSDWSTEKANGLIKAMALDEYQQVGKLSKGMRARLKIVLAMAREAPLILLDEPLSGIDVPSRGKIVRAIVSEYRSEEQTIILSTHEVADTESIYDHVLLLDNGKVKLTGEADKLRSDRGVSIQGLLEEEYS